MQPCRRSHTTIAVKHWALRATRGTTLNILAEIFARAANTIFFILLARRAGAGELEASIYGLGFAYTSFLTPCALGGLDQLLNREVSRDSRQGAIVLGNFLLARVVSAALCYGGLAVWVLSLAGYDSHVAAVVLVLGLTLIPDGMTNLLQGYLIAHDSVGAITVFGAVTGGLKLVFGGVLLLVGGDAVVVATVVAVTSLLTALIYLLFVGRRFEWPRLSFDRAFWARQARAEFPLLLIALLITIEGSMDVLLLSRGGDILQVGVYTAALSPLNALLLIPQSARQIILAIMAGWYDTAREQVFAIYEQAQRYLLILTLLITLSLMLTADQVLPLIYRGNFGAAVPVFQVVVWSFAFATLMVPNGRLVLVANLQSMLVPIQLCSMVLNVAINLLLQPALGPLGAAIARVSSTGLAFVIMTWYVWRKLHSWPIWPVIAGPLGAGLALLLAIAGLRWLGMPWLLALAGGWLAFGAALFALGGVSVDELRSLKSLFQRRTALADRSG